MTQLTLERESRTPEIRDAKDRILKAGDPVRLSEAGRKEITENGHKLEYDPIGRKELIENYSYEQAAIHYRGKVIDISPDGLVWVENNGLISYPCISPLSIKPEYLVKD